MSVPKKHHYLPIFFIRRWCDPTGKVTEYRRPAGALYKRQKHPAATGYLEDLYANDTRVDPLERQAFERLYLQQVDSRAADALLYLEEHKRKPSDPALRDAWTQFLMSLMHRSPERVRYLTDRVRDFEHNDLNPDLEQRYETLRTPGDPEHFHEWYAAQGSLTPELTVRLLSLLMDSQRIGDSLNAMHWSVHVISDPRHGFLTGDHPIMISNGLGHNRGFVLLAISPSSLFIAAHDPELTRAFTSQRPNDLERALNDACVRQSHHIVLARDHLQSSFIDKRFLKMAAPVGSYGIVTWAPPLIDM